MSALSIPPQWEVLQRPKAEGVKAVFYPGLPFRGHPTRVFAYRLPSGPRTLCIRLRMPHGHGGPGEKPKEIAVFADSILKGGAPLAKITGQGREGRRVWATFQAAVPVHTAELNFTKDKGRWQHREWKSLPATVSEEGKVTGELPEGTRVYYFDLLDERNCVVSTEHEELP